MQAQAPDIIKAAPARHAWVDATKGVAIILVVIGHAWRGIDAAGLLQTAPAGLFNVIDARIYAFHMPLFFYFPVCFLCLT